MAFFEKVAAFQLNNYYLLHKIDKFYVNVTTKEITFDVDGEQMAATTTNSSFVKFKDQKLKWCGLHFVMESKAFDYCKSLLSITHENK